MQVFDDLPQISLGNTDFLPSSGLRNASDDCYIGDVSLGPVFLGHETYHALKAPSGASTMSRYLQAPDQNPLLRNLIYPRTWHRAQPDSPELGSAQIAEPPWPLPQDYDRQSSPDSTSWSCSSGKSFARSGGDDHYPFERSYCLSPQSNMFSWSDDHSSAFERGESHSHCEGSFADKVACISPCDLQHYPDADPEQAETDTLELEQSWPASYPSKVEVVGTDQSYDNKDGTGTSEDETLLDADGEDIDENEHDDYDDDTYEPRKMRSSTISARRRSATQSSKLKAPSRGHKRTTSSTSASNKITKTSSSSQIGRSRGKNAVKHELTPDSPGTPTNNRNTAAGGSGGNSDNAARPFPCPLAAYNCTSAFGSKNEWKRHISSQHLRLGFWRCDLCSDGHATDRPNDFNRKDLFTQHLRRMHGSSLRPPPASSTGSSSSSGINSSRSTKHNGASASAEAPSTTTTATATAAEVEIVRRCYRVLRQPPMTSSCLFCPKRFEGVGSWDERVEHVGKHLENERKAGREPVPVGQWGVDRALEEWLVEEGMVGKNGVEWEIRDGQK